MTSRVRPITSSSQRDRCRRRASGRRRSTAVIASSRRRGSEPRARGRRPTTHGGRRDRSSRRRADRSSESGRDIDVTADDVDRRGDAAMTGPSPEPSSVGRRRTAARRDRPRGGRRAPRATASSPSRARRRSRRSAPVAGGRRAPAAADHRVSAHRDARRPAARFVGRTDEARARASSRSAPGSRPNSASARLRFADGTQRPRSGDQPRRSARDELAASAAHGAAGRPAARRSRGMLVAGTAGSDHRVGPQLLGIGDQFRWPPRRPASPTPRRLRHRGGDRGLEQGPGRRAPQPAAGIEDRARWRLRPPGRRRRRGRTPGLSR